MPLPEIFQVSIDSLCILPRYQNIRHEETNDILVRYIFKLNKSNVINWASIENYSNLELRFSYQEWSKI